MKERLLRLNYAVRRTGIQMFVVSVTVNNGNGRRCGDTLFCYLPDLTKDFPKDNYIFYMLLITSHHGILRKTWGNKLRTYLKKMPAGQLF